MEICEKCSSLMVPNKDGNKVKLICRSCGRKKDIKNTKLSRIREKIIKNVEDYIPVLEGNDDTLPKTKTVCSECGNKEAYWWMKQTRSSDEPETRFYRCTQCRNTWREYS